MEKPTAWTAEPEAEKIVKNVPIKEVVIDGVAVLRILKHCNERLPTMVAGSLLGLDTDGVLEVTYSYAFPVPKGDNESPDAENELDGTEYQIEMMKMLRDVNIDNNCVGWYQSMYLGTICTNDVVGYQYNYQSSEELSDNSIVLMYDPIQSKKGTLIMKAFRLTDKFIEMKRANLNKFIKPAEVLEEIPLKIRNIGLVSAYLKCLKDLRYEEISEDFEPLSMSTTDSSTEKHLELLGTWIDDLVLEQQRFQLYSKSTAKPRQEQLRALNKRIKDNQEARDMGEYEQSIKLEDLGVKPLPEAPSRNDHILMLGQLDRYCQQLNEQVDSNMKKILLASKMSST